MARLRTWGQNVVILDAPTVPALDHVTMLSGFYALVVRWAP